jgi:hypothetical protein
MRTLIFSAVFILVFTIATFSNQGGGFGFGNSTFTTYGWPAPWLHVHIRDTRNSIWINGKPQPGERTTRIERIELPSLAVSVAALVAIAGIFTFPVLLLMGRKSPERSGRNTTEASVD